MFTGEVRPLAPGLAGLSPLFLRIAVCWRNMTQIFATALLGAMFFSVAVNAAGTLKVTIDGVENSHFPKDSVECVPDGHGRYASTGHNSSPRLRWTAGPEATKSYAVLMTDPDVPADLSNLNKAGVTVPANAPRQIIYHWVLIGIPADRTHLSPGDGNVFAEVFGVPKGNAHGDGPLFYEGGYSGPCPPWNDMRPHRYRVQVFALDVAPPLTPPFDGKHFQAAIAGHVLAEGEASASYATNAALGPGY